MRTLIALLIATTGLFADSRITAAEAVVTADPSQVTKRLDLIQLLLERYRYTADPALSAAARKHLDVALRQDGSSFLAKKHEAFLTLLEEDFVAAKKLAEPLNRKSPDDVDLYGYLVDAESAIGNYDAAEKHANWMLRLRPENRQGMRRAAELRVVFGDVEGAILMLNEIYRLSPRTETVERAWVFGRLAHLTMTKNPARAEQLARESLKLEPECFEGATALAAVLAATKRHQEAAEVLKPLADRTQRASVFFALGRALTGVGDAAGAETAFARAAKLTKDSARLSDVHAQMEYLLEVKRDPVTALHLAEAHSSYRNVWSLTWYSEALAANGATEKSREIAKAALAAGSKEPRLMAIATKLGVN
ncbi:MAG: tetratricopeptide repeat protein [Bryobacterales bacterium]|nr:tetratricopeptide repeat protein [Bryobacterales bacterium]